MGQLDRDDASLGFCELLGSHLGFSLYHRPEVRSAEMAIRCWYSQVAAQLQLDASHYEDRPGDPVQYIHQEKTVHLFEPDLRM